MENNHQGTPHTGGSKLGNNTQKPQAQADQGGRKSINQSTINEGWLTWSQIDASTGEFSDQKIDTNRRSTMQPTSSYNDLDNGLIFGDQQTPSLIQGMYKKENKPVEQSFIFIEDQTESVERQSIWNGSSSRPETIFEPNRSSQGQENNSAEVSMVSSLLMDTAEDVHNSIQLKKMHEMEAELHMLVNKKQKQAAVPENPYIEEQLKLFNPFDTDLATNQVKMDNQTLQSPINNLSEGLVVVQWETVVPAPTKERQEDSTPITIESEGPNPFDDPGELNHDAETDLNNLYQIKWKTGFDSSKKNPREDYTQYKDDTYADPNVWNIKNNGTKVNVVDVKEPSNRIQDKSGAQKVTVDPQVAVNKTAKNSNPFESDINENSPIDSITPNENNNKVNQNIIENHTITSNFNKNKTGNNTQVRKNDVVQENQTKNSKSTKPLIQAEGNKLLQSSCGSKKEDKNGASNKNSMTRTTVEKNGSGNNASALNITKKNVDSKKDPVTNNKIVIPKKNEVIQEKPQVEQLPPVINNLTTDIIDDSCNPFNSNNEQNFEEDQSELLQTFVPNLDFDDEDEQLEAENIPKKEATKNQEVVSTQIEDRAPIKISQESANELNNDLLRSYMEPDSDSENEKENDKKDRKIANKAHIQNLETEEIKEGGANENANKTLATANTTQPVQNNAEEMIEETKSELGSSSSQKTLKKLSVISFSEKSRNDQNVEKKDQISSGSQDFIPISLNNEFFKFENTSDDSAQKKAFNSSGLETIDRSIQTIQSIPVVNVCTQTTETLTKYVNLNRNFKTVSQKLDHAEKSNKELISKINELKQEFWVWIHLTGYNKFPKDLLLQNESHLNLKNIVQNNQSPPNPVQNFTQPINKNMINNQRNYDKMEGYNNMQTYQNTYLQNPHQPLLHQQFQMRQGPPFIYPKQGQTVGNIQAIHNQNSYPQNNAQMQRMQGQPGAPSQFGTQGQIGMTTAFGLQAQVALPNSTIMPMSDPIRKYPTNIPSPNQNQLPQMQANYYNNGYNNNYAPGSFSNTKSGTPPTKDIPVYNNYKNAEVERISPRVTDMTTTLYNVPVTENGNPEIVKQTFEAKLKVTQTVHLLEFAYDQKKIGKVGFYKDNEYFLVLNGKLYIAESAPSLVKKGGFGMKLKDNYAFKLESDIIDFVYSKETGVFVYQSMHWQIMKALISNSTPRKFKYITGDRCQIMNKQQLSDTRKGFSKMALYKNFLIYCIHQEDKSWTFYANELKSMDNIEMTPMSKGLPLLKENINIIQIQVNDYYLYVQTPNKVIQYSIMFDMHTMKENFFEYKSEYWTENGLILQNFFWVSKDFILFQLSSDKKEQIKNPFAYALTKDMKNVKFIENDTITGLEIIRNVDLNRSPHLIVFNENANRLETYKVLEESNAGDEMTTSANGVIKSIKLEKREEIIQIKPSISHPRPYISNGNEETQGLKLHSVNDGCVWFLDYGYEQNTESNNYKDNSNQNDGLTIHTVKFAF